MVGDLKTRIGGAPKLGTGRVLIALQIGVSMPLVAGAALLLETMANLSAVELGFNARDVVIFRFDPTVAAAAPADQANIYRDVLVRLGAIAGVDAATIIENPLAGGLTSRTSITVGGTSHSILMNAVGPGFVETMGMRLVGGRQIAASDLDGAPRVAMVNEAAVRTIFGGAWPVGRRVGYGRSEIEIVGIVSDNVATAMPVPTCNPSCLIRALQRSGFGGHHLALRTSASPASLEGPIQQALAGVNRRLPVPDLRTHVAEIGETTARERVFAQVLTIFSGFALLLAAIGLYGITAYAVARRTTEIGLRVALGSRPAQVLWLFVRQVAWLTAVTGLALGIPLALGAGRLVSSLLFGVSPNDAILIGAASLVMVLVSLASCLLPARRAAAMDPLVALRAE